MLVSHSRINTKLHSHESGPKPPTDDQTSECFRLRCMTIVQVVRAVQSRSAQHIRKPISHSCKVHFCFDILSVSCFQRRFLPWFINKTIMTMIAINKNELLFVLYQIIIHTHTHTHTHTIIYRYRHFYNEKSWK